MAIENKDHAKTIADWFLMAQKQYGQFESAGDEAKAMAIYQEGCVLAYTLGRESPEIREEIDRRYRIFKKDSIERTRLKVATSALQGILAGMIGEIKKKEDKLVYQYGIDEAVDLAVYSADALLKRLMYKKTDIV